MRTTCEGAAMRAVIDETQFRDQRETCCWAARLQQLHEAHAVDQVRPIRVRVVGRPQPQQGIPWKHCQQFKSRPNQLTQKRSLRVFLVLRRHAIRTDVGRDRPTGPAAQGDHTGELGDASSDCHGVDCIAHLCTGLEMGSCMQQSMDIRTEHSGRAVDDCKQRTE